MIATAYRAQVDLMLQLLPDVAKEKVFALKGGTAINMFVRDMPRLSVDIDLTYLPFDDRNAALRNISEALGRIKERLSKTISGIKVASQPQSGGQDAKLLCRLGQAQVKIEVNTVMRGHILPVRLMQITGSAEEEFKKSAAINVIPMPNYSVARFVLRSIGSIRALYLMSIMPLYYRLRSSSLPIPQSLATSFRRCPAGRHTYRR